MDLSGRSKRPVTSCRECYRRKQKCNRQKPCNHCTSRSVQDRCTYNFDSHNLADSKVSSKGEQTTETPTLKCSKSANGAAASEIDFQQQLGYPEVHGNTSLTQTQEFLIEFTERPKQLADLTELPSDSIYHKEFPPPQIIQDLLEVFWKEANWYLEVVNRYYFDKLFLAWWSAGESSFNPTTNPREGITAQDFKCFPALLFQILAVALQFFSLETVPSKSMHLLNDITMTRLSEQYSEKGEMLIMRLGRRKPSLTAIQHDLLRATWLKNMSKGSEAWYPLGTAIRQGQDMGLHLLTGTVQTPGEPVEDFLTRFWYEEYKRRMWVILFIWDSHVSAALGRPRAINVSDCTTTTPIDCTFPASPSTTVPATLTSTSGDPRQPPSTYSGVLFVYELSHALHDALTAGVHKRPSPFFSSNATPNNSGSGTTTQLRRSITSRIKSLLEQLPPAVRTPISPRPPPSFFPHTASSGSDPPTSTPARPLASSTLGPDTSWDSRVPNLPRVRELIASTAHSCLLWLHRPHARTDAESRCEATHAALRTLESQQRWFELTAGHRYRLFTLSLYTFDAALFLVADLVAGQKKAHGVGNGGGWGSSEKEEEEAGRLGAEKIHYEIRRAIARLGLMKGNLPMARNAEAVLVRYYKKVLDDAGAEEGKNGRAPQPQPKAQAQARETQTPAQYAGRTSAGHEALSSTKVNPESANAGDVTISEANVPPLQFASMPGAPAEFDLGAMEGLDLDLDLDMDLALSLPEMEVAFEDIMAPEYNAAEWMQSVSQVEIDDPGWIH